MRLNLNCECGGLAGCCGGLGQSPDDTYTLPVEVFKSTVPVPVSAPVPEMMPIGQELTPPCIYSADFVGPIPPGCLQERPPEKIPLLLFALGLLALIPKRKR